MAALLDNLPIFYTIGRRGNPNLLVTLMTKNLEGSSVELASSIVIDTDLELAKRRLMGLKKADHDSTRDCVLVQVYVNNTGKTVYDPEPPEEVSKSALAQTESTGFCSPTLLDPDKVEEAWKSVPEYTPPKQESDEHNEKKPSFLEKLKKILF